MIYRLEIENFYSVRDSQVIDLTVPRSVTENPERFAPIFPGASIRAPKVVALFGANGSGKSTVLKALAFLAWFVKDSFSNSGPFIPCEAFNDEESANRPIRLAVEFGGPTNLSTSEVAEEELTDPESFGTFRYELELTTRDWHVASVKREALRLRKAGKGKWQRAFERSHDQKLQGSKKFPLSGLGKITSSIPTNASVISTLARFEHDAARAIATAAGSVISNILIDKTELGDRQIVELLARDPSTLSALNEQLQRIDMGVKEMVIDQTPDGPKPFFRHEGLHSKMPWSLESFGTRTFIRIYPYLTAALAQGGVATVDELDLSVHSLLLPEIVGWFYDDDRNPLDAQLWFTCHSTPLMAELCKEEIVLCEKDREGRSSVYSLMDVKNVRRGENLYKKYLGGEYGAIPHIG